MTKITQRPWTRIRPLQRDEIDPYTHAAMVTGERQRNEKILQGDF